MPKFKWNEQTKRAEPTEKKEPVKVPDEYIAEQAPYRRSGRADADKDDKGFETLKEDAQTTRRGARTTRKTGDVNAENTAE